MKMNLIIIGVIAIIVIVGIIYLVSVDYLRVDDSNTENIGEGM